MGQGRGKTGDLGDLPPPGQQRQSDDRQDRAGAILRIGIARVGRPAQNLFQRIHLRRRQRQLPGRSGDHPAATIGRQFHRPQLLAPLVGQRAQPQFLGPFIGHIKISAMPAVARAPPHRLPVAGLVTSALVSLRIGETFRQQGTVAETFLPLRGQRAQGRRQHLRSQIGRLALGPQEQKAPVLHDQFQPLHPLRRAPADPQVPVFERVAGRPPDQQRHRLALQFHHLTQIVAHRPPCSQIMMLPQLIIEPLFFL